MMEHYISIILNSIISADKEVFFVYFRYGYTF